MATIPMKAFFDEALLKMLSNAATIFNWYQLTELQFSCRVFIAANHITYFISAHLAGILSNRFASCNTACFGHRTGRICRYLSLYRANREVTKVSLQIIFVCRSETGLLALVCKKTRR